MNEIDPQALFRFSVLGPRVASVSRGSAVRLKLKRREDR